MRKLISFISVFIITVMCVTAHAANIAVIAVYDADSRLIYGTQTPKSEDGYVFRLPKELEGCEYKVFGGDEDAKTSVLFGDETPEPTEAPTPEPNTATEEPTTAPAPTKTPYPEVYEKALDAVNAPAVVKSVNEQLINGETWYKTVMLYQGVEMSTDIYEGATIVSAPQAHAELVGQNAEALREGDVIHFTCDLQGRVKSIEFIYRPNVDETALSSQQIVGGDNYSTFYFGVPIKTAKGYMLVADRSGKTSEIDLSEGTFIYTVSPRARGDKVEFTGTGYSQIPVSRVRSENFDSEDNVILWDEVDPIAYVLVRARGGSATEVIVIEI